MDETNKTQKDTIRAGNIEAFLKEMVETLEIPDKKEAPRQSPAGRKMVLPALVLWSGVVVGILRGFTTQIQIWRLVSWQGLWAYPLSKVSDQAVYNRLGETGNQTLQLLFLAVRDKLKERLAAYVQNEIAPFATGVYAIDGSTLDKMARHLPSLKDVPNGDSRLLPGKMVGLFDIRFQQWREMIHLSNPNQNDKVAARELVKNLPKGSLILADLGFFSFAWLDQLTDWKMWWVSRIREKTTFEIIHTFYEDGDLFDGIVWLGKYRADRAAHAVRLVTFTMNGTHYRYLTNVLDPQKFSLHDIAVLYARRWDIELAFKMVKRHLNLHLIWSGNSVVILQQLWAVLIIAQILHAIQLEIAGLAEVDPFDVSLDLLTRYVPLLASEGKDPINMIVEDGRRMGIIRPSRRIRPQTPAMTNCEFHPLPSEIVLRRKSRYAARRCKTEESQEVWATKISSLSPVRLC